MNIESIIKQYLSYGLRCEILDYKSDYVGEKYNTLKGFYLMNDKAYFNFKEGRDYAGKNTTQFKPILRPFSDLTKEITVKGETFIPIYKLFELEYKGTTHFENVRKMYFNEDGRFIEASHLGTGATTSVNVLNPNKNNYWKIQKLHEWHFDTDAMINNNYAVDFNDVPLAEC